MLIRVPFFRGLGRGDREGAQARQGALKVPEQIRNACRCRRRCRHCNVVGSCRCIVGRRQSQRPGAIGFGCQRHSSSSPSSSSRRRSPSSSSSSHHRRVGRRQGLQGCDAALRCTRRCYSRACSCSGGRKYTFARSLGACECAGCRDSRCNRGGSGRGSKRDNGRGKGGFFCGHVSCYAIAPRRCCRHI